MKKNQNLLPGLGGKRPHSIDPVLFNHVPEYGADGRPKIDIQRMVNDPEYAASIGATTPPRAKTNQAAKPVTITLEESESTSSNAFKSKLTISSTDDDLQTIYDWCYDRFGLDSERWSLTGSDVIWFRDRADADAVIAKWNGYGALEL